MKILPIIDQHGVRCNGACPAQQDWLRKCDGRPFKHPRKCCSVESKYYGEPVDRRNDTCRPYIRGLLKIKEGVEAYRKELEDEVNFLEDVFLVKRDELFEALDKVDES